MSLEQVLDRENARPVRWVCGFFDPLLAEHARRLNEMKHPGSALAVVIEDPPSPLLAARARAELVAALDVVDYVVLEGRGIRCESLDDLSLRERFCEHVASRARMEGCG